MDSVLKIKNLQKTYKGELFEKGKTVLHDLSFSVIPKTLTGFLGANGSGKTTTIKSALGLVSIDNGSVTFFGDQELSEKVKGRIGYLPEKPNFYDHLTGEELIMFAGQMCTSKSKKEIQYRVDEALKIVKMDHARNVLLREYSKGMYQRIGIAQSFVHNPDFIIMDEPMGGLDPQGRDIVKSTLKTLKENGMSVLLCSHLLSDIEDLCVNLVILKEGACAYEGTVDNFLSKIDSSYEIIYANNEDKFILKANSLEEAQQEIDRLRQEKKNILNMTPSRPSLEKAFVDFIGGEK